MLINLIGECDKRPVLYTLMKICQELGDVLVVSSSSRLLRLSDTRVPGGHYQNTMIQITQDGLDDFLETFDYDISDFEFVIVDNIVAADADVVIHVQPYVTSDVDKEMLSYIENVNEINLYRENYLPAGALKSLEMFESLRNMEPISEKVATKVANILAPNMKASAKSLRAIALRNQTKQIKK